MSSHAMTDFKRATKHALNARKNFSCNKIQFMKIFLTRSTGAAIISKRYNP